jgi:putative adhesin
MKPTSSSESRAARPPGPARTARRARVAGFVLAAAALPGCDISLGHLAGRASEEWTHTYPLAPGGEVRVDNTNGRVDVEGSDGSMLEIRAEKIARAATDEGARELLPRITIREQVKPDRVSVETERMSGLLLGAGYEVRYYVKAPRKAVLDVRTTNGAITIRNVGGPVTARSTNGVVRGTALSGAVDARTTNGGVNVDLAAVGDHVSLTTTNGGVTVAVPETAKADVSATWTNGGIKVSDVKIEVVERSRRRFEGKMNGGGPSIDLHTTNGGIRIRSRSAETEADDTKSKS